MTTLALWVPISHHAPRRQKAGHHLRPTTPTLARIWNPCATIHPNDPTWLSPHPVRPHPIRHRPHSPSHQTSHHVECSLALEAPPRAPLRSPAHAYITPPPPRGPLGNAACRRAAACTSCVEVERAGRRGASSYGRVERRTRETRHRRGGPRGGGLIIPKADPGECLRGGWLRGGWLRGGDVRLRGERLAGRRGARWRLPSGMTLGPVIVRYHSHVLPLRR